MPDSRQTGNGGDPWDSHKEQPAAADPEGAPTRPLTSRYLIGLGLIAVFAISSTYMVARALSQQEADTRAVTAANQLAALSLEISSIAESLQPDADRIADLGLLSAQIQSAYFGLKTGTATEGETAVPSDELSHLFETVDETFIAMLENVETISQGENPTALMDEVNQLVLQSEAFRTGADSIAFQYAREAEQRVQDLKKIQLLLLSGILVLVVFEAIFLFRPIAKRIREGWTEREEEHEAEREQDREQLNYLAQFDPLTGLANRVLLRDRLEHAVVRARRDGTLVSVMFLDLDDFKAVNDQLGHHIGDQLLRQVSRRLQDSVRESDTVARLGGDEFMIILEGGTRPEDAGQVAEKILSELKKPFLLLDRKLFVTGSIGIVVYPLDGESIDGLLRDADLAMYSAKDAGKNTYQFVTAELRAKTSARIRLLDSLRVALSRDDELWLAYQPKLALQTGRVTGVEALLRWNHPEMGEVMPGDFIPIAEETDLMLPLGEWVITEACHQAREWMDSSLPSIAVSINVAARQFRHGDLVETVGHALRNSGVDPRLIELELTEGTLIEDTEMARRTLERLKEMGVRISIDDFGTGYSSLSYLKQFPIDYLKIDRSFITDLHREPDSMAIPTAVIRLAHSLSLKVIAEGVETQEQHDILSELNCDIAQGYLFGRPVPPLEIEDLVRKVIPVKV